MAHVQQPNIIAPQQLMNWGTILIFLKPLSYEFCSIEKTINQLSIHQCMYTTTILPCSHVPGGWVIDLFSRQITYQLLVIKVSICS